MTVALEVCGAPGLSPVAYIYAPTLNPDRTQGTPYDFSTGQFSATPAQPNQALTAGSPVLQGDGVTYLVAYDLTISSTPQANWPDSAAPGPEYSFYAYDPTTGSTWGPAPFRMASGQQVGSGGTTRPGVIALTAAGFSASPAPGTAVVTLTRTGGADGAVGVTFATSDGTAVGGTDYTPVSTTVGFADGQGSASVNVTLLSVPAGTAARTVNLTISSPTGGASLGTQTSGTLTIPAAGAAPRPGVIAFASGTLAGGPAPGVAIITVARTGGADGAVSVNLATSDGTAVGGTDYTPVNATVNFADGQGSAQVGIILLSVAAGTAARTVNLTLSGATGGATLGGQSSGVLTIAATPAAGTNTVVTVPSPGTTAFGPGINSQFGPGGHAGLYRK